MKLLLTLFSGIIKMADHKLDIFETLNAIDKNNTDFYSKLSSETKKGFAPLVVLRWTSAVNNGSSAQQYLISTNEKVNKNFWDLVDHPELQYKLLASCGIGRTTRHQWIPMVGKAKQGNSQILDFLSDFYPEANDLELNILINQFTDDTFREFVLECGCSPQKAQEILDAYDIFTGKSKPKPKKRKT